MTTAWLSHLMLGSLGLLAVSVVALPLRTLSRRDPELAYRILTRGLLAILLVPVLQWSLAGVFEPAEGSALHQARTQIFVGPIETAEVAIQPDEPPDEPRVVPAQADTSAPISPPRPGATANSGSNRGNALLLVSTPIAAEVRREADIAVADPRVAARVDPTGPVANELDSTASASATPTIDAFSPAISIRENLLWGLVLLYLAGAACALIQHLWRLGRTCLFLRRAAPVTHPSVLECWERISSGSALRGRVRLLHSDAIGAPACWGLIQRAVILPTRDASDAPAPALEWAMTHELEHLERKDPRTAFLQGIMVALFWFHPTARWLSREIDRVRELSCDHRVVRREGNRRSYALALLEYAKPQTAGGASSCAFLLSAPGQRRTRTPPLLHWSRSATLLRRRIDMLLKSRKPLTKRRRLAWIGVAGASIAIVFAGQITIAATFPSGDGEWLVACDKKTKKVRTTPSCQPNLQTPRSTPPRPSKGSSDITRGDSQSHADLLRRLQNERGAGMMTVGTGMFLEPDPMDAEVQAALFYTLQHDDYDAVRMAAAEALAPHCNQPDVRRALLNTLRQTNDKVVRAAILDALLRRESISPELKELLAELCSLDSEQVLRIAVTDGLRSFGDDPEARAVLLRAIANNDNEMVQMNAVKGLAPFVADSRVREALVTALRTSRNEVARMVMIDALAPLLADHDDVRTLFALLIEKDDNRVARMAVAEALAVRADDADVRAVMLKFLQRDIDDTVQMAFAEALALHVDSRDVRDAFIQSLRRIDNEVIRMTVVQALAGAPSSAPWHRARQGQPAFLPQQGDPALVPVVSSRY